LHSENITHRGIKPDNIFVIDNSSLEIKIGNYGLANYDEDQEVRFKDILTNYSLIKLVIIFLTMF